MKILTLRIILFFCFLSTTLKAEVDIRVYTEKIGDNYAVLVDNKEYCPISIRLNFVLKNMTSNVKNDSIVLVPSRSFEHQVAELKPTIKVGEFSYNFNFSYNYGDVTLTYFDSDFIYNLPFEKGKKFKISQGYYGKKTHKGINALDFNMPLKTPIYAARGGTVIEVVTHNDKNCFNASCDKFNNYLLVYHTDGTFSQYAHISKNGSKVKVGDVIKTGQLICVSGNTGYSSGPHLHFSVYLPLINDPEYIQTYFNTKKQAYTLLEEGKTYKRIN